MNEIQEAAKKKKIEISIEDDIIIIIGERRKRWASKAMKITFERVTEVIGRQM